MLDLIGREPVVAAVLTLVGALISLLVAFGVDLTATQQTAIAGFCVAALALAVTVRKRVTPMSRPGGPYARARVLERAYEEARRKHEAKE